MEQSLAELFEGFRKQAETWMEASLAERVRERLMAASAALGLQPGVPDAAPKPSVGAPFKHSLAYMKDFIRRWDAAARNVPVRQALLKEAGLGSKSSPDYWRKLIKLGRPVGLREGGRQVGGPAKLTGDAKRKAELKGATRDALAKKKWREQANANAGTWKRRSLSVEERTRLAEEAAAYDGPLVEFAKKNSVPYTALQWWMRQYVKKGTNGVKHTRAYTLPEKVAFVTKAEAIPPVERKVLLAQAKVGKTTYLRWKALLPKSAE